MWKKKNKNRINKENKNNAIKFKNLKKNKIKFSLQFFRFINVSLLNYSYNIYFL